MPGYKNPTTEHVEIVLAAVQRAAIRGHYAVALDVDPGPCETQRDLLVGLFLELFGDAHDDRLRDAYFGEYDTGRRETPVLPRTDRTIRFH